MIGFSNLPSRIVFLFTTTFLIAPLKDARTGTCNGIVVDESTPAMKRMLSSKIGVSKPVGRFSEMERCFNLWEFFSLVSTFILILKIKTKINTELQRKMGRDWGKGVLKMDIT